MDAGRRAGRHPAVEAGSGSVCLDCPVALGMFDVRAGSKLSWLARCHFRSRAICGESISSCSYLLAERIRRIAGAALLPLLVLLVLRSKENGAKIIFRLGLLMAAAWLTNLPAAVMLNYSLALLMIVMAITQRSPRFLLYGAAAVALGAALAAFYLVPAVYEQRWVDIANVLEPGERFQDNFLFTVIADLRHDRFNLLVSVIAFAELIALAGSAVLSWRRQKTFRWPLIIWTAAIGLLLFPITRIAWEYLPELRFMQLPWRWLLCFNFSFALLFVMAWRSWVPRALLYAAMLWHWLRRAYSFNFHRGEMQATFPKWSAKGMTGRTNTCQAKQTFTK